MGPGAVTSALGAPVMCHPAEVIMPASLLASQFATLEEPPDAMVVDAGMAVADEVARIRGWLGAEAAAASLGEAAG